MTVYGNLKKRIVEIATANPALTNHQIAMLTGSHETYVYQVRRGEGLPMPVRTTVESAMSCPECGGTDHTVTDSRPAPFSDNASIRRRRKCRECGFAWTTYEIRAEWVDGTAAQHEVISRIEAFLAGLKARAIETGEG